MKKIIIKTKKCRECQFEDGRHTLTCSQYVESDWIRPRKEYRKVIAEAELKRGQLVAMRDGKAYPIK